MNLSRKRERERVTDRERERELPQQEGPLLKDGPLPAFWIPVFALTCPLV